MVHHDDAAVEAVRDRIIDMTQGEVAVRPREAEPGALREGIHAAVRPSLSCALLELGGCFCVQHVFDSHTRLSRMRSCRSRR